MKVFFKTIITLMTWLTYKYYFLWRCDTTDCDVKKDVNITILFIVIL